MASIQEQMEALNKQEQYILEHPDTREGAMEAQQYSLKKIKEKQQELSKVLGIGPSGTTRDIIDVYKQTNQKGPIPDFYSEAEDIDLLRQWETDQGRNISLTPEFKGMDPTGYFGGEQEDVLKDILDNLDPKYEPYRNILQRKLDLAKEDKKISFLQGLGQWWREDAPKKLSDFSPVSSAMAGELSSEEMAAQRAIMKAEAAKKVPTPTIKTTAPGQSGGYQYQDTAQDRQEQREQERQVQRETAKYKDTATTGAKAGYKFGLQEGGMVDQRIHNPLIKTSQLGIMGLQGYQGGQNPHQGGQNPFIQTVQGGREQYPPRGIFDFLGGPRGLWPKPKQAPWEEFGEQLGGFGESLGGYEETLGGYEEQLGGFGETLGGYGEQIGGFGEQMSGVEEAMGGFGEQFKGLNNRLDSMEKGIASLSDQLQPKQPQFGGYGGYGGMGGYGGGFGGGFGYRGRYG